MHYIQYIVLIILWNLNPLFMFAQNTMDQLEYIYNSNSNQLNYISDNISSATLSVDIDNQTSNNYEYNLNGQLTKDELEGIVDISWTVIGKPKLISLDDNNDGTTDRTLQFYYDALGNKVKKTETSASSTVTTFYVHNASGELISTYKNEGSRVQRNEVILTTGTDQIPTSNSTSTIYSRDLGFKNYELKDHSKNVRVTVTDVKEPNSGLATYSANLTTSSDYYSFGMLMPGRDYNSSNYNWGFQGKEKNTEVYSDNYDFEARFLDARVGRWLSMDPKAASYPDLSPYNFCANNPTYYIDPDGMAHVTIAELSAKEQRHTTTVAKTVSSETPYTVMGYEVYSYPIITTTIEYQHTATIEFDGRTFTRDADAGESWDEVLAREGYYVGDYKGERSVFTEVAPLIPKEDFVGWGGDGDVCFDNAKEQAEQVPGAEVGWKSEKIQVYTTKGGVNTTNAQLGVETTVDALEAGIPIVFGLDYDPGHYANDDKTTDHFVTVVGMSFPATRPGQMCFTTYENATGDQADGTNTDMNYFCVNPDGSITGQTTWTNGVNGMNATTVSQVRPNRQPLPSKTAP